MAKLCKCGAIVDRRCAKCYPAKHDRTTKERGYGHDHRTASERYRAEHPLCECCVMSMGVIGAKPSMQMHHVVKIVNASGLRMQRSNWLAVCDECHERLEADEAQGKAVKAWSEANYESALSEGCTLPGVG